MNLIKRPRLNHKHKRKILVISGWWFRWTYALWILKALEELKIDKEIDAIYWVSIWAIIWSARANWMKAEEIFKILTTISITDFYWKEILKKSWWFMSNKKIKTLLNKHLPKNFKDLKIRFMLELSIQIMLSLNYFTHETYLKLFSEACQYQVFFHQ